MKKFFYVFISIVLLNMFCSCGNKKSTSRNEQIVEFRSSLTTEDTTAMLKLADDAMEHLKARNIDQVLASLYEYNDSTEEVKPLSEVTSRRYARKFKMFPVIEYQRIYYSFMLAGCNDVKYSVTFATAEQTGSGQPAVTSFMFNPIKIDGEWKLCVKTLTDETTPISKGL